VSFPDQLKQHGDERMVRREECRNGADGLSGKGECCGAKRRVLSYLYFIKCKLYNMFWNLICNFNNFI